jgi:pimeloyl-ACP methyl ester carboxylesterase
MNSRLEKLSLPFGNIEVKIIDNEKENSILLLHGFNDSKETFIFLEEFLNKNFNIVSIDFPGHGGSDWKKEGQYFHQENLLAVHSVAKTYLPKMFTILAHSMGAGIASRYTGLFPETVNALICLEGFSGLQPLAKEAERIANWLEAMLKKSNKSGDLPPKRPMKREEAIAKLGIVYQNISKEKVALLVDGLIRPVPGNMFVWKNDPRLKSIAPIPFPPDLSRHIWEKISCPVLMIYGEKTHLRPNNLEEIKSHFKNISYHEISNSGHNMHHDNSEKVIELLSEFFESHFGFIK